MKYIGLLALFCFVGGFIYTSAPILPRSIVNERVENIPNAIVDDSSSEDSISSRSSVISGATTVAADLGLDLRRVVPDQARFRMRLVLLDDGRLAEDLSSYDGEEELRNSRFTPLHGVVLSSSIIVIGNMIVDVPAQIADETSTSSSQSTETDDNLTQSVSSDQSHVQISIQPSREIIPALLDPREGDKSSQVETTLLDKILHCCC